MKIFLSFVLLAVLLMGYLSLDQPEKTRTVTGLPWQIEILPDGTTQVFGIQIGGSRLSDVIALLGEDLEIAIIAATDEPGRLEMYYSHYRAGLLSGKLILLTDADEKNIKHWRENSVKSDYVGSGRAKKYFLSDDDLDHALNVRVTGLIFIPSANLDDEIILSRFGEPDRRVQLTEATYYLYPQLGLVVTLHEESAEVIQYVAPNDFHRLSSWLLKIKREKKGDGGDIY